jgi:membrane protein implicated in regulation of membrane protease activity
MTLIYVYVFALVLGGILLVTSIVMGGDDASDVDSDLDTSVDTDVDADADVDVDHGQQGLHTDLADTHGTIAGLFTAFLSLRFWTFFAAFFGLTGLVIDGLDLVAGHVIPLGLASGMGVLTGYGAVSVLRYFATSETGAAADSADYVGKNARVMLPIASDTTGKVRLQLKGTTVDLLATSDEPTPFAVGDEVLIVQMQETTAVVARLGPSDSQT